MRHQTGIIGLLKVEDLRNKISNQPNYEIELTNTINVLTQN